jgi:hypothetical protein
MEITIEQLKEHKDTFEKVGLLFWDIDLRDPNTPKDANPFACTGGEGVHYSLLPDGKVVMTVPANFQHTNFIVGNNLYEFLCLGYNVGYFVLEYLSRGKQPIPVRFEDLIATMKEENKDDEKFANAIEKIRDIFKLKPLANIEDIVYELQHH